MLSACQSGMIGGDDPMGSVAARLTHAGLPAVLAMTHSVLVVTTRALFGQFYRGLARGRTIGTALDNARRALYTHPDRGERRRGAARVTLELQDWFLPALYQSGHSTALLTATAAAAAPAAAWGNLREVQESGFHGRSRALWQIERWFVGGTRRLVVHGFGGQGKTALAEEAGRWLHHTGLFARVCFIGYAAFQGVDPVGVAVSTLGTVLERNLLDAEAAGVALRETATLVILDNLEQLEQEPLRALLEAAVAWSEAGASRVLITTRQIPLGHPRYPREGSHRCRYLALDGLEAAEALAWFQALMQLPPEPQVPLPEREPLLALFHKIAFHPLSIGLLARQLKERRIAELGERLEALLRQEGSPLRASLALSLDRLDPAVRQWLPRLGVFQGGALEAVLVGVTDIAEEQWVPLRQGLEQTGLIALETVPGTTSSFLRFHPTLAPALWDRQPADEQARLAARYREHYYHLSRALYQRDGTSNVGTVRALAQRELPNLLAAVHGALAAGEAWAVDFADNVNRFLANFGLSRDQEDLIARAQAVVGKKGSQDWYRARSSLGERLYDTGRFGEAEAVFREILAHLGETPAHRRCATLVRLARCHAAQGQGAQAEAVLRQALSEAEMLEASRDVRDLIGTLQAELGDTLIGRGDDAGARAAHQAALGIAEEIDNQHGIAVSQGQLGGVALEQNDLDEAERRYREATATFHALADPRREAVGWHMLGLVLHRARRWDEAEQAYRESARLKEDIGHLASAAETWGQLANLMADTGKPDQAEAWYRKALAVFQSETTADRLNASRNLSNLAAILKNQPGRLADARACAEEALAIKATLDPAAAEIWKTYTVLANIAEQEGKADAVRAHRRQAREAFAAAPAGKETLRRDAGLIAAVVGVVADPRARAALEEQLQKMAGRGWGELVAALGRILDGERDADALCAPLDREDSLIVHTVLQGIADPAVLQTLVPAIAAGGDGSSVPGDTKDLLTTSNPDQKREQIMTTPSPDQRLEQISDHLRFLGYDVNINDKIILAQHPGKPNIMIKLFAEGVLVTSVCGCKDTAKQDRMGYLEFINTANEVAHVARYYADKDSDFFVEAWYSVEYSQVDFGRFLGLWDKDFERLVKITGIEKYLK